MCKQKRKEHGQVLFFDIKCIFSSFFKILQWVNGREYRRAITLQRFHAYKQEFWILWLLPIRWAQISFVRMRGRGIVDFFLLCTFLSVLSKYNSSMKFIDVYRLLMIYRHDEPQRAVSCGDFDIRILEHAFIFW